MPAVKDMQQLQTDREANNRLCFINYSSRTNRFTGNDIISRQSPITIFGKKRSQKAPVLFTQAG